jgi:LacI family transcriptional regulator
VGIKTVSRVVNGEHGVREEIVERVSVAISLLQHQRNDIASTLRPRTISSSIGLVIENLASPFYADSREQITFGWS